MERKDLIMQEEPQRPEVPEAKLAEVVDEGATLIQMMETRGWKLIFSKFIEPRKSLTRILAVTTNNERNEACGAVKELTELMNFINGRIENGQKANVQLETIRKGRK